ncbi:MAG: phosphatase PAP2 family protein [Promethearchaeota archaeon]
MNLFANIKESITTKLLILVLIPWIILSIIFGFTDLEISKAIVNTNSLWGKIGADYAYAPAYTLILISIAILIGGYFEELKNQKIVGVSISLFIMELFSEVREFIFRRDSYLFLDLYIIIGLLVFSVLTLKKDWKEYMTISIVILLLATILTLSVDITKILCGRVRFEDLDSNFSNYTPWFLPPGPDPNNTSFPSGHTAHGWMSLPLLILIKDKKWKDPTRITVTMLVIGWGLFVAISRVIIGAHYASDVLFSTGAATVITILLYKWFYINKPNDI